MESENGSYLSVGQGHDPESVERMFLTRVELYLQISKRQWYRLVWPVTLALVLQRQLNYM